MKLIAIKTENSQQGNFVYTAIQDARDGERVRLEDVAVAEPTVGGVHLTQKKGKLSRMFGSSGIDEALAKRVAGSSPDGVFVFALGEPDQVDLLARRVRTISEGAMKTFDVGDDAALTETTGHDETYELQDTTGARREEEWFSWSDVPMSKQRLEQE